MDRTPSLRRPATTVNQEMETWSRLWKEKYRQLLTTNLERDVEHQLTKVAVPELLAHHRSMLFNAIAVVPQASRGEVAMRILSAVVAEIRYLVTSDQNLRADLTAIVFSILHEAGIDPPDGTTNESKSFPISIPRP
jgi:hypothetical protein